MHEEANKQLEQFGSETRFSSAKSGESSVDKNEDPYTDTSEFTQVQTQPETGNAEQVKETQSQVDIEAGNELEVESNVGYKVVQEKMQSPAGRVELWNELKSVYVAPVEKQGYVNGHTSLKEYAKANPLVAKFRKAGNKLGEILTAQSDASEVPTLVVMKVNELFIKIDTLHEVIVELENENTEETPVLEVSSERRSQAAKDQVSVQPTESDMADEPAPASVETIRKYKQLSRDADNPNLQPPTPEEYAAEEEEAMLAGRKKVQVTRIVGKKGKKKEVTRDEWQDIRPTLLL